MTERTPLAHMIRNARLDRGMSQVEVADRAGVGRTYYAALESGQSTPRKLDTLEKVASALDLDPEALLIAAGGIPQDVTDWLTGQPEHVAQVRALMAEDS